MEKDKKQIQKRLKEISKELKICNAITKGRLIAEKWKLESEL